MKWAFTLFMLFMIPTYWIYYGPFNFLWFSDIVLLLTYLAVMTENTLLASMAAIGGMVLELLWIIDFIFFLFFDIHLTGLSDYMFNQSLPLWLRALSFFHIMLPPLLLWLIIRLGYDRRAWLLQTFLSWIVIFVTWFVTDPLRNINFVFKYKTNGWISDSPLIYLTIEALAIAVVYAITHGILVFVARSKKLNA